MMFDIFEEKGYFEGFFLIKCLVDENHIFY
jgi:hypothetical protein